MARESALFLLIGAGVRTISITYLRPHFIARLIVVEVLPHVLLAIRIVASFAVSLPNTRSAISALPNWPFIPIVGTTLLAVQPERCSHVKFEVKVVAIYFCNW